MIEVEGQSIEADEWSLMLAWSVLALCCGVPPAAGQHLTLVKRRGDGKIDHVFARKNLVKRKWPLITSENNYFHKQLRSVVVCRFDPNVEGSSSNLVWHNIFFG
jgi:hypothetical protein